MEQIQPLGHRGFVQRARLIQRIMSGCSAPPRQKSERVSGESRRLG